MNPATWRTIGIVAALLLLPLLTSGHTAGMALASVSYLGMSNLPRGMRNNNPGNIRIGKTAWKGKIPVNQNTDGAFEQFQTFAFGVRAMIKNLQSYQRDRGLDTLSKIITTWAPAADNNNTMAYIAAVNLKSGLPANEKLDLYEYDTMRRLIQGMTYVENGKDVVNDEMFNVAWKLV